MVKALESGRWKGQRYWVYVFNLEGIKAQDVEVGRSRFLDPMGVESFKRLEPDLAGSGGDIGDGFLIAQKREVGVWIALGYIGWDGRLVIGDSALNEVIEGFNPPRNQLVLYKRDIVWLKRLRDKKTLVAREAGGRRQAARVAQEVARDRAIEAALQARRVAKKADRERRQETLANLQAVCTTLSLERKLEPVWGFRFTRKLGSLEKRIEALEDVVIPGEVRERWAREALQKMMGKLVERHES